MNKFRAAVAVFALFAAFTVPSWAGDMGMPPIQPPIPEPSPEATPTQAVAPADDSTVDILDALIDTFELITSLT